MSNSPLRYSVAKAWKVKIFNRRSAEYGDEIRNIHYHNAEHKV